MAQGKIITFYSYKGGVGRSMILANVAWILASNGKRVLVIDWDLEAPGLHQYFHPFLLEKDLSYTEGLIDFLTEFEDGVIKLSSDTSKNDNADWYEPFTNILRYAESLEWEFPGNGTVDFVPAGRQGKSYATKVNLFNWHNFYERLGGGMFLEEVKKKMRTEYDYVLIDSRTGVSDTSGICTIQMPDILVILFTANNQSLLGAEGIAGSVIKQWNDENNQPANERLIFPVLTRTDYSEKAKLTFAKNSTKAKFSRFLNHISDTDKYFGDVEIRYDTWYAFEEVLATFEEISGSGKLLGAIERLVSYITQNEIRKLIHPSENEKKEVLSEFDRSLTETTHPVLQRYNIGRIMSVEKDEEDIKSKSGKIITFYSYKGGVGRSMILANAAWILATYGNRVLVVDWDLEAPGLHRYFHPFLAEKKLNFTKGFIDFVRDYKDEAIKHTPDTYKNADWYDSYTNISRYATSLEWRFPDNGTIDFVPAGQQGQSYAEKVNLFNWNDFYERLGGRLFLEAVKKRMYAEYDYILIDSRTGVNDTSGICTTQMPDALVILFTANNQTMLGAEGIATSVYKQWYSDKKQSDKKQSDKKKRIYPVLARAEHLEKKKLYQTQNLVKAKFDPFLHHISNTDEYWEHIEIPYIPWYSYEEILATFGDDHTDKYTLLEPIEHIVRYLTEGEVDKFTTTERTEQYKNEIQYIREQIRSKEKYKKELLNKVGVIEKEYSKRMPFKAVINKRKFDKELRLLEREIINLKKSSYDRVNQKDYFIKEGEAVEKDRKKEMDVIKNQIFIGYSSEDKKWLYMLTPYLKNAKDKIKWYDQQHIPLGVIIEEEIKKAIDSSQAAIFLMTPHFFASDYIMKMVLPLIKEKYDKNQIRIFPVHVNYCPLKHNSYSNWLLDMKICPDVNIPLSDRNDVEQFKILSGLIIDVIDFFNKEPENEKSLEELEKNSDRTTEEYKQKGLITTRETSELPAEQSSIIILEESRKFSKMRELTVAIICKRSDNETIAASTATGFFIEDGIVITCYNVIWDKDTDKFYPYIEVDCIEYRKSAKIVHAFCDKDKNLAVLYVPSLTVWSKDILSHTYPITECSQGQGCFGFCYELFTNSLKLPRQSMMFEAQIFPFEKEESNDYAKVLISPSEEYQTYGQIGSPIWTLDGEEAKIIGMCQIKLSDSSTDYSGFYVLSITAILDHIEIKKKTLHNELEKLTGDLLKVQRRPNKGIQKSFHITSKPITSKQYSLVFEHDCDNSFPIEVTWDEANQYTKFLNGYLPSKDEWCWAIDERRKGSESFIVDLNKKEWLRDSSSSKDKLAYKLIYIKKYNGKGQLVIDTTSGRVSTEQRYLFRCVFNK